MKQNKERYAEQLRKNEQMSGLSKIVGELLMLPWIKGNNWMGGLPDSKANKIFDKIMSFGYDFDEIYDEWQEQMDEAMPLNEAKIDDDILNEIENEIYYQFKLQDSKPVYVDRPEELSDRYQLTLRFDTYDGAHIKLAPIKRALSKFGPVKQSTFKHDRLTSGNKEVTFEISKIDDMHEDLTQYYGVDKYGHAKFVAMSEDEVKKWAEKHPEDGIVEIEDSNGRKFMLSEALHLLDKREFEENSNTYELEMLYESVKTTLSAQQKNDLARFVRKAKTAEEVNTYMAGMIAQDSMTEDVDDDYFGSDYEQNLNKIKDLAYDLEVALNDLDVWVDDVWYDGYERTITVFVSNGDWKHDHWKLDNFLRNWIEQNNLDADVRTNDLESDSDVYDAYHIIKFRSLNEGYVAQKPTRFTNGQLRDFDPYTFVKNIMRSGKSMNSVRDCGPYQYTIFVNYKEHFGPRGIDDLDTLYMLDIIREDESGNQFQDIIKKDLLWNEVAETLKDWKEETILADDMRKNAAMPY